MSQRKLNHFSDFLYLAFETADVFVRDLRDTPQCLALRRNSKDCSLSDQDSFRKRIDSKYLEGQPSTKVGNHDIVSLCDGDAFQRIGEILFVDWRNGF